MGGVETLISVGKIVRPHGIRGDVKVVSLIELPERFEEFHSLYVEIGDGKGEWVQVEMEKGCGREIILKLAGIDDRDRAESLRGAFLKVRKAECLPLPEAVYYISELIGLKVRTKEGEEIGLIVDVLHTPAHDVYVVDKGGRENLIPAVKNFIKQVDVSKGFIIIDSIEGLLD